MKLPYEEFDLSGIRTYPRVAPEQGERGRFCDGAVPGSGMRGWGVAARILAGADFAAVVDAIAAARARNRIVLWGIGAHVVKTGLGPVLIDLMERGFVSALATNGAAVIHDFELALSGATSEEVDEALGPGRFGMADETGSLLNAAINDGVARGQGLGQRWPSGSTGLVLPTCT